MTTAVENALHAWVVAASGLAPDKVIWENQGGTRPVDPFITLLRSDQVTKAAFDQLTEHTDLDRPQGEEIELRVEGWREFTLTLQAFTHDVTGDACAFDVLTRVQTKLGLPSIRDALGAVDITPSFARGTVRNVPKILGTSRFEARAIVDINFFFVSSASEFTGYIDQVQGSGTLAGTIDPDNGVVDIDIDAG